MSTDELAVYDARIELIDFPIEVFHDTPSREFLDRLLSGDVRVPEDHVNDHLDAGFDHVRAFVEANADADRDELYADVKQKYTTVFVGPRPPVLLHETYYRDDTDFIGQGLAEVESSYSAAGWQPPEEYGEENDFVAVELAFLRWLVDKQRQGMEEAFGYERVFLDTHLTTWVEAAVDDVHEETDNDLFLAAAEILLGLVEFEDEIVAQVA
ncbi:TorD/DmsD family molecular chaperone [Halobaculum gomorrense]|uniref:Chaperone TorD involved in molybdoenzyme TorA maturation n=1 Tax=Halobaculum gomorrense TaxID=43928 RepID=A0A1M5M8F6_9EURY|nr:molecular chaperone TorD family protein [Halobaculum gomorrense]SHG73511.1 chaperone TorD involved in molybdoenzyme TorA maturation [Halobaculum gomorrense]